MTVSLNSIGSILDQRIWSESVGPPAIAPPPPGPMPAQSRHMKTGSGLLPGSDGRSASPASTSGKLSLSSLKKDKKEKEKGEDGAAEGKKKKGLFKMNWG